MANERLKVDVSPNFTTSKTCVTKDSPADKLQPRSRALAVPNTHPTSAYLRHYSEPWLLGESSHLGACGGHLLSRAESTGTVPPFRLSVCRVFRVRLSTGFSGGEPWSRLQVPGPYPVPFWSSLLVHVGLLTFTMVQPSVRVPTHGYLLAGVVLLDSALTRFSSRFTVLMTSRHRGDDAVPCSRGVGDCTQRRTISCQGLWPCRSSPGLPAGFERTGRTETEVIVELKKGHLLEKSGW